MSFLLLPAAVWLSVTPQASRMSLEDAIKVAQQNAFSVNIADSNRTKVKAQFDQAKSGLLPKLTIDTSYTRFDRELTSGGFVTRAIDSTESRLSLSFPVDVSGTITQAVRATRRNFDAFQAAYQAELNNIKLQVREAYFQVLQSQAQVQVAEENLNLSKLRLKNAEASFRNGAIAKVDVLRFETLVSQAEAELIATRNGLKLAQSFFNNVLARPVDSEVELSEVEVVAPMPSTEGSAIEAAMKFRPDLASLRYQTEAFRHVTDATKGGLKPSLGISFQHSHNFSDNLSGPRNSWIGVINLSIPVLDSGFTKAKVKAAQQDEVQAKLRYEQAQLGASLEVRQALTNMTNAKSRITLAENQVRLAEETYRLSVIKLEAGEGIVVEVTDAQSQLIFARNALIRARYDFLIAHAQLQRAIGNDDVTKGPREE